MPVVRFLDTVGPLEGSADTGSEQVNGFKYIHTVRVAVGYCYRGPRMFGYDLGRDWQRFRAVLGLVDSSPEASVTATRCSPTAG
ncbi:MAG: hypothetical protein ACRDZ4_15100 [Egibacteraceae bacterium]